MFALAKSNRETVAEHTKRLMGFIDDLREVYKDFLADIDWDILHYAAKYHDIGKINPHFQYKMHKLSGVPYAEKLKTKGEEYPHNYLSGAFLDYKEIIELFGIEGYVIILNAIHYHHCREIPYKPKIKKYVSEILNSFINNNNIEDFKELNIKPVLNTEYLDEYRDWNSGDKRFPTDRYIKIKGLLHRLDYCASAYIEDIEKPAKDSSGTYLYEKILEMYCPNDVQKYMLENRDKNLIVEASTGIGKTEAALLWIGSSKGFYTLPLQVSINAIYDRIVSKKYLYDRVGLLHANALSELIARRTADEEIIEETIIKYQDARLLSMPLTICTVDQLFNFVYKYNGYEMILTTLANSKVVIDEIQSYSPQNIGLLIAGLKMITELGGKFAIVTATFPKVLYKLFDKYNIQVEPGKNFHNPKLPQRHKIKVMGDEFDYEKIKTLGMNKKVLVICNTVRSAVNTYERLIKDDANVKGLLHSRYIRKHRALIEAELLKFAENNPDKRPKRSGIWVTTQIVEASLDVDFDVLVSEACSIDSLLQRMGRVYRSRLYTGDEYNVYVVNNRNGVGKGDRAIIDEEIYERSMKAIFEYDGQILTESDSRDKKQEMMDMVYSDSSLRYVQKIEENLNKVLKVTPYMLENRPTFRDINNITVIPICFKDKVDKLVDQIKNSKGIDKFKLLDEMQSYTLGINFYNSYKENLAEDVYRDIKYINNVYEFNEKQYFEEGIFSGIGLTDKVGLDLKKENLDASNDNLRSKGIKNDNIL